MIIKLFFNLTKLFKSIYLYLCNNAIMPMNVSKCVCQKSGKVCIKTS